MSLSISKNLSKACVDKIYIDLIGFNVNQGDTNKQKIENINTFLSRIQSIFDQKIKITINNWKMIGRYIFAFARMYHTLLTDSNCKSDYPQFIGQQKKWTNYLCTGKYRPMRLLYKLLGYIGILYTDCTYFYLYDTTNKNKKVLYLSFDNTLDNLYNPLLRFSKSQTKSCISTLKRVKIEDVSIAIQYIGVSLEIRKLFLTGKYCGGYIKDGESDVEHEFFETNLSSFQNILHTLLQEWNNEHLNM